jgi:ElaB/YqjD/DUF883 family membrane-anchored ribosome-binding protein
MSDTISPEATNASSGPAVEDVVSGAPREHFTKAIDEAKAAALALGKQAQDYAGAYQAKFTDQAGEWTKQAKGRSDDVVDRAFSLANEGKARASGAILSLGKLVEDNASVVDEHAGVTYGDYVRTAGKSVQDFAGQLDSKEFTEIADEVREFVRTRPGAALGIAAAGGFVLARMFGGSSKD